MNIKIVICALIFSLLGFTSAMLINTVNSNSKNQIDPFNDTQSALMPSWYQKVIPSIINLDVNYYDTDFISRSYALLRFYTDASGGAFYTKTNSEGFATIPATIDGTTNFFIFKGKPLGDNYLTEEIKSMIPITKSTQGEAKRNNYFEKQLKVIKKDAQSGNLQCGYNVIYNNINVEGFPRFIDGALIYISNDISKSEAIDCLSIGMHFGFGINGLDYNTYANNNTHKKLYPNALVPTFMAAKDVCNIIGTNEKACWNETMKLYSKNLENFIK